MVAGGEARGRGCRRPPAAPVPCCNCNQKQASTEIWASSIIIITVESRISIYEEVVSRKRPTSPLFGQAATMFFSLALGPAG